MEASVSATLESSEDDDNLCGVLEMLNFSVADNSQRIDNSNNAPAGRVGHTEKDNELVLLNIMLSTDLFIARGENRQLSQQLKNITEELEQLKRKQKETETTLEKLGLFANELQNEFGVTLVNLSDFVRQAKSGGKKDFGHIEFLEFLRLLDKMGNTRIPLNQLGMWSEAKKDMSSLNGLLTLTEKSNSPVQTPSQVPLRNKTIKVSTTFMPEVASTTRTVPGENTAGSQDDDDIVILEENLVSRAVPVTAPAFPDDERPPRTASKNPYSCSLCGKCYLSKNFFLDHVARFHNACLECNKIFPTPVLLNEHIQKEHHRRKNFLESTQSKQPSSDDLSRAKGNIETPGSPPQQVDNGKDNDLQRHYYQAFSNSTAFNVHGGVNGSQKHGILLADTSAAQNNRCFCGEIFSTMPLLILHILSMNAEQI